MCVLLPLVHDDSSAGYDYYSFGVLILFNLILSLLIILGQVFVRMKDRETKPVVATGIDCMEVEPKLLVLFFCGCRVPG